MSDEFVDWSLGRKKALTVSDVSSVVESEFGSRLEPLGFKHVAQRRWIRSQKLPIRELFVIGTLKGAMYSPAWGFSSGLVPSLKGRSFRRQSTDKNAVMDLVIDPIDVSGSVPPQAFGFISGDDTTMPTESIRKCAEHFVPIALADFDRVSSLNDLGNFFLERSRVEYRRFGFNMYVQHQLVHGFVLILMGRRDEGLASIQEFCRSTSMDFSDQILEQCILETEARTQASKS